MLPLFIESEGQIVLQFKHTSHWYLKVFLDRSLARSTLHIARGDLVQFSTLAPHFI